MTLTPQQIDVLLRPIKPGRVAHRDGMSNVEAYDIRAHLNRIFGFGGWSLTTVHEPTLIYEHETTTRAGKPAFKVAYRATLELCILNTGSAYTGSAVGESIMPDFKRGDAHDMALKTAESQALKRAAMNLGDQFGLSLYAGGSLNPIVGKVVGHDSGTYGDGQHADIHEPDVVPEQHDAPTVPHDAGEARFETPEPDPEQLPMDEPLPVSAAQIRKMQTMFGTLGIKDRDEKIRIINISINRTVGSSKELTEDEARTVITALEAMK